jgi:hypothetical protein
MSLATTHDPQSTPAPLWTKAGYLFVALALIAFLGYFVIYNIYAASLFQFPFDYDQGEGFELEDTVMFSQGHWPYRSDDTYPFYSSNYPPVFHLAIVPLVWIFGAHYWTGRVVAYVGTLVTAAAIGYAVQRGTRRWWLALLSGLELCLPCRTLVQAAHVHGHVRNVGGGLAYRCR